MSLGQACNKPLYVVFGPDASDVVVGVRVGGDDRHDDADAGEGELDDPLPRQRREAPATVLTATKISKLGYLMRQS